MSRGNKSSYTSKQQRSLKHIEANCESQPIKNTEATGGTADLVKEYLSSHFATSQLH